MTGCSPPLEEPRAPMPNPGGSRRFQLNGADLWRLAWIALVLGLLYLMFHQLGAPANWQKAQRSTIVWMVLRWYTTRALGDAYYVLGWAVPLTVVVLLWRRRRQLMAAPKETYWPAVPLLIGLLVVHWMGVRTDHHRLSVIALFGLCWVIPLYLAGRRVARLLILPCAFLFFLMPWNFLDGALLRVRAVATRCANLLLNGLGFETQVQGFQIVAVDEGLVVGLLASAVSVGAAVTVLFFTLLLVLSIRRPTGWRIVVLISSGPAFLAAQALLLIALVLAGSATGSSAVFEERSALQMALVVGLSMVLVAGVDAAGRFWWEGRQIMDDPA